MVEDPLIHKLLVLLSACMILGGVGLGIWAVTHIPSTPDAETEMPLAVAAPAGASEVATATRPTAATAQPAPTAAPPTATPIFLELDPEMPAGLGSVIESMTLSATAILTRPVGAEAGPAARFDLTEQGGRPVHRLYFAAATRFDTVDLQIDIDEIQRIWRGRADEPFSQVAVLSDTLPTLVRLLGQPGTTVRGFHTMTELTDGVWADRETLAIVPFDQLQPRLAVLAVGGQNPIENASTFDPDRYPLVADVYIHLQSLDNTARRRVTELLARLPASNRDPTKLTVVAMTGVTAMVRLTAAQMDRFGPRWPAEEIGPELASADITAISNEVPFVPGCETNTDPDNLIFCSKPEYMEALEASGADIIGLTGNHQNDFGRENALTSLEIYEEEGLPVYGGGRDKEAAFAPLIVEHNGNRLAFLGANSFGPKVAWATDTQPGSAEFNLAIMSATVRNLKAKDIADLALVELQYQESYDVRPLFEQRQDFNALVRAGADIVTGVQSHVPQGLEFSDGGLILYGLGNLYFDQMWSQATRDGLIAKHTIYNGRHISTQLLTTLLHEYGQPHLTDPEDRKRILQRVFGASYW